MPSKSWPTARSVQCQASRRKLVEDCRSHGSRKTSKRNSEETPERAGKRSRTGPAPSEGCSQALRDPSSSGTTATSASVCTGPPDSTISGETSSLSAPSSRAVFGTEEGQKSNKKKSSSGEIKEGLRKRSRKTPSPSEGPSQTLSSSFSTDDAGTSKATTPSISTEAEGRKSGKRKSAETEGPRKRGRKTPSPSEGPSHQTTTEAASSDKPGTSSSVNTGPPDSRAAFEAKYTEEELLGAGGFGSVYAGYRKDDNLPVAIKRIPQFGINRTSMLLDGKISRVALEVALLLKFKPAASGTSAVVTLLDWYDLDYELILVLERPVPCLDLVEYMNSRECTMQEHEAKTITKQLVDALIEVHSRGVFHRDIKMDNILIETGSDVPRVRLIDFGCGTFLSEGRYISEQGTYEYTTPEWFLRGWYRAEPTTVWQLGVVVFGVLHGSLPFSNSHEIMFGNPEVSDSLSFDCQGFLLSCLVKSPEGRPSLETLKYHPWLM